jgi:hypothetical protein
MKIVYDFSGTIVIAKYDNVGCFEHVINTETQKKMMVEYTQIGTGYEITDDNGYIKMKMCNAVYVRIMDLDVFIPKFIFILNNI